MSEIKVRQVEPFSAEITVPGDKSISHRAVMFAALSNGVCDITGFLASEDCLATVKALRALGVKIEELNEAKTHLRVHGNRGEFSPPQGPIDCGNSGTTMRLLAGILATQPFATELTGDASLSKRPMKRIAIPLELMGAKVEGQGVRFTPPLRIQGTKKIKPIEYISPVASAQIKSAVLLAGMLGKGKTSVTEPSLSRDHTERLLDYLLVKIVREGTKVSIWGDQIPESRDLVVPGDISSAAFWVAATAGFPGSRLLVNSVGLNRTRVGLLDALIRMGAQIRERVDESGCEPVGSIEVKGGVLQGIEIGGAMIPTLIDEVPILAVAGAMAKGKTIIRDAGELRVKESDRISTVAENLRRMGVGVEEFADGMEIQGEAQLKGAVIESLGDHRIAMAFAIAGLRAKGETVIRGAECIETSYPGFAEELAQLIASTRKT
jgi:3-phosphoshikimate 1-carboxyvinyltransferase